MPRNSPPKQVWEARAASHRSWRRILQWLLGALVLVNVLFFALALKPAGLRAREQAEMFRRLQSDLESRRGMVDRLRKIVAGLDEGGRQDTEFYRAKFLPKPTGFSIVMEELDRLAKANRVRKGTVSYALGAVRGRPELNQVDVTTMLEGDYTNIVQFVNQVERSRLFLVIDNVTVAGGDAPVGRAGAPAAGQARLVRLSLRLVTFFQV